MKLAQKTTIVLSASLLLSYCGDVLIQRNDSPKSHFVGLTLELNGLLGIPVHEAPFDVTNTGMLHDLDFAAFCTRIAHEARSRVRSNTVAVVLIPGNRRDARGWPFVTRDWHTNVQIVHRDGIESFDVAFHGKDGLLWTGFLGNAGFYCLLILALCAVYRIASTYKKEPKNAVAGFPVILHQEFDQGRHAEINN